MNIAVQALSQSGTVSSPHPRRKGLPHLTEDSARDGPPRSGSDPLIAGGGGSASARSSIKEPAGV